MNSKSEKQKMLDGELYNAYDPQLVEERKRARGLVEKFNATGIDDIAARRHILEELFGKIGRSIEIEPPFHCDYGKNIHAGKNFYMNFGCVILDCAGVHIGDNTTVGAGSVVTKDLPDNVIAAGNPCRIIRQL